MTVGERIKKAREHCEISQTDLAKKIGVSKQSLYKYETNIVTNIPSNVIEQIAIILDVSPCYLMGWEENDHTEEDSPKIMQYYDQLNDIGKHEAIKRVMELTEVPRYLKNNENINSKQLEFSKEFNPHFIDAYEAREYLKSQKFLAAFDGKTDSLSDNDAIIIANKLYVNNYTK